MRTTVLSLMSLALALVASSAQAADCEHFLVANDYSCHAVVEDGQQFLMQFHFRPSLISSKFALRINNSTPAQCSCKAEHINIKKPEKIKFDRAKTFHCFMSGPEFGGPEVSGPELSGPENFLPNQAAYEGVAKGNGIHHGEAVDRNGHSIVYDCDPGIP